MITHSPEPSLFYFIYFIYLFFAIQHPVWGLSSLTRDGIHEPCSGTNNWNIQGSHPESCLNQD